MNMKSLNGIAMEDAADTRPILIVPYMWIGDFVRGHTVVRVLKQRWPNRPVDLLVTSLCAPLVDYMPGVRAGIVWDLPRGRLARGSGRIPQVIGIPLLFGILRATDSGPPSSGDFPNARESTNSKLLRQRAAGRAAAFRRQWADCTVPFRQILSRGRYISRALPKSSA